MARTVYIDGKKTILDDADYLSAGGEATVWLKDGLVIKLWDKLPSGDFARKLELLRPLGADPAVVAPRGLALDAKGALAGYAMAPVTGGIALAQLFTSAWQTRHGVTAADVSALVKQMIATIRFVHGHGVLIVDGNEFNYLVTAQRRVHFIDVDSWQVPGFPATAILPAIRDWSSPGFSEDSDWFSFGVIATQLYLGIHPFKGTWQPDPALKDLRERQLRRLSVFNAEVSLPQAARPAALIPANFRDWLLGLFETGRRGPPPEPELAVLAVAGAALPAAGALRLEQLLDAGAPIRGLWLAGLSRWTLTDTGLRRDQGAVLSCPGFAGLTEGPSGIWLASCSGDAATLVQAGGGGHLDWQLADSQRLLVLAGRLFILDQRHLAELDTVNLGGAWRLVERQRWPIAGLSAIAGEGMLAVDCLGAAFLYVPGAAGSCAILRARELDGHQVLAARAEGRVAMAISWRGGQCWRSQWHLSADRSAFAWMAQEALDEPADLQFAVVKDSIVVEYLPDDSLRLRPVGGGAERLVANAGLAGLTRLAADQAGVLTVIGDKLFRASLGS
jgi:hypothetical protein